MSNIAMHDKTPAYVAAILATVGAPVPLAKVPEGSIVHVPAYRMPRTIVAVADGRVTWRSENGSESTQEAPKTVRVLADDWESLKEARKEAQAAAKAAKPKAKPAAKRTTTKGKARVAPEATDSDVEQIKAKTAAIRELIALKREAAELGIDLD